MKDFTTDTLTLGVVGAGAMGRGIAQIAAAAGIDVILHDMDRDAATAGRDFILSMFSRAVEKGRMESAQARNAGERIKCTNDVAQLASADLVIEAIIENLEIKQSLFQQLEQIVSPDCILATNTSSLSVTAIANTCERPEQVAGYHFFNPVPLMKLVEVVSGFRTEKSVLDNLTRLAHRLGHTPVNVMDSPGFLVNHAGRGLNTEGLRILQENITDPATVDAIMRESAGFRMGPFELMDLTGLDVTFPVTEEIHNGFYQEPRLRPTPGLRQRFVAGVWGKKTGGGFYQYSDGQRLDVDVPDIPDVDISTAFWVSQEQPELATKVTAILTEAGATLDDGARPGEDSIAIITPKGLDATSTCLDEGLNPTLTVAVDALFVTTQRLTLMTTPKTSPAARDRARAAFSRSGRQISVIRDSAGFVAPRIVANIVNIACDIAQQGIASPGDIDTAVKLGLGYPEGPLAMGDSLGADTLVEILEQMMSVYGDPRYRPSPWLRRRAQLGMSLLEEEL